MTIEIGETTIGMWCVSLENSNWLAHLARLPSGKCALDYRFRWYEDDKIEDSADRKNWYHGELSGTESEVLRKIQQIFTEFSKASGGRSWELLRGERTPEEFSALLMTMPGIHARVENAA